VYKGFFPQCEGTGAEDRRFRAALQPQAATFYLDSYGGFHSPEDCPTLLTYFRDATLARIIHEGTESGSLGGVCALRMVVAA
jgi:hypothetical protein